MSSSFPRVQLNTQVSYKTCICPNAARWDSRRDLFWVAYKWTCPSKAYSDTAHREPEEPSPGTTDNPLSLRDLWLHSIVPAPHRRASQGRTLLLEVSRFPSAQHTSLLCLTTAAQMLSGRRTVASGMIFFTSGFWPVSSSTESSVVILCSKARITQITLSLGESSFYYIVFPWEFFLLWFSFVSWVTGYFTAAWYLNTNTVSARCSDTSTRRLAGKIAKLRARRFIEINRTHTFYIAIVYYCVQTSALLEVFPPPPLPHPLLQSYFFIQSGNYCECFARNSSCMLLGHQIPVGFMNTIMNFSPTSVCSLKQMQL